MAGRLGQVLSRLTGLSTPILGASWNPPASERDAASRLITFLEDRRVLFTPSFAETPGYCVASVIEIRQFLTSELMQLGRSGVLVDHLRAIRAACRHFLDRLHARGAQDHDAMGSHGHWQSWEFQDALGQLRGLVGVHLAFIVARYELKVEGGLAAILPPAPVAGDDR